MFSSIVSGAVHGISSYLMQVEVDVSDGLPGFNMVGFMSGEVREAGDRVRVALKNIGVKIPSSKITINLSPAEIKKEGVIVDLPVAIGILTSIGEICEQSLEGVVILGQLGLDGEVKHINGTLPIVIKAKEAGYKTVLLPSSNAREGAVIEGVKIVGVDSLQEAVAYLNAGEDERDKLIPPTKVDIEELFRSSEYDNVGVDFSDINGQAAVKRAVEIAAAGFHHVLIVGPPGSGKSMVAKRMPTILPPLSLDESLEVSTIYSVAGMLGENETLITKRPFMSPHHLITETALTGGGNVPRPGVISLSHRGILFLDEMPEFPRSKLDLLRQPIEDRKVNIVRNKGNFTYPADFQLVGALNPCPCGYYPDRNKCKCTANEIRRYLGHISGPILDRIDICVEAPRIDIADLTEKTKRVNESSKSIRKRVLKAREIQQERFKGTDIRFNSEMSPSDIKKYCKLGKREENYLENAFCSMDLSARAYHKILRVARTIADIDESENIMEIHLMEAVGYRMTDGKYWHQLEE
ncbi:YifB family Mg chelatase-like AAA ATPase [Butyrivibrio sp. YAB3001]|uniref:YifB family Mg chelatase-like AAA ATPase n=1 Tax=Butyrivibrio sp. YAB3001 TaxID=1520812 RepID=UPI0008F67090|nr:YifB family Mg chelatase-like AAA ATPase [Butyrivibrio sp. YAB3001]SFB75127.1 magnesium chelatase family protein [Butyrivibrio sp. YAB3001]